MKKILLLFIATLAFSAEFDELLEKAKMLENEGNYKEAMLLYKDIANRSLESSKYIENINQDSITNSEEKNFANIKKAFFEREIKNIEDEDTKKNIKQVITKDFGIYPYKKNYFLPASYTFNNIQDRHNFETNFQLSVEKPLSYNLFGFDETISLAYTQRSFWQTTKHSAPFRETNYEPEVFALLPIEKGKYLKAIKTSFMHSSNGKRDDESRSLNRIYTEAYFQFSNLFVIPRVWYRIPEPSKDDDNKHFYRYYGYGDITLLYAYKEHTFDLLVRNNLRLDKTNKGALEFNWTFPLPEFISSKNTYGMFQVFHGYGQSLIDYDREVTNIGFGIALSR